ncbi:MAG TPA: glycosyltransferase family 4 protein, partial [Gaiellaceae bacterium]|nr:glycosyltransferase family 4 protein [Gaiellaceae bacterium]
APFGGDCVLMLELGRAAQERGFDVDVLATDPHFQEMIRSEGLGLVDLDVIRREIRPLWDLRGLLRLRRFLARSPYAIVHTHTTKPGIVGTLAARRAGVPAVMHTVHLFPFHEETGRLVTGAYVAIERLAARWCDRIVTVSESQRDWALRTGIGRPGQVVAIPNGVPADRAKPRRSREDVRAALGLRDHELMILSTGRLAEQKGLEYLIRAAALLRNDLQDARILLAGDGPLRDKLAKLVSSLELDDRVVLLGRRSDVGDLLVASDLVVLPSLWEGLSISLLEAMAAGRPVITTSIASNREVTNDGEAAVLVPPKDVVSLAAAIRSLAADPTRQQELAKRGQEVQRERYGLQRMLDVYMAEYERLTKRESVHAAAGTVKVESA